MHVNLQCSWLIESKHKASTNFRYNFWNTWIWYFCKDSVYLGFKFFVISLCLDIIKHLSKFNIFASMHHLHHLVKENSVAPGRNMRISRWGKLVSTGYPELKGDVMEGCDCWIEPPPCISLIGMNIVATMPNYRCWDRLAPNQAANPFCWLEQGDIVEREKIIYLNKQ